MMNEKFWYITYQWFGADETWHIDNCVSDVHPVEWIETRHERTRILFFHEIAKERFVLWME